MVRENLTDGYSGRSEYMDEHRTYKNVIRNAQGEPLLVCGSRNYMLLTLRRLREGHRQGQLTLIDRLRKCSNYPEMCTLLMETAKSIKETT